MVKSGKSYISIYGQSGDNLKTWVVYVLINKNVFLNLYMSWVVKNIFLYKLVVL